MGDDYCDTHDVDVSELSNRDECPYCRMEEDRRAQEVEMAQRNAPRSVDDPASIEAYRR